MVKIKLKTEMAKEYALDRNPRAARLKRNEARDLISRGQNFSHFSMEISMRERALFKSSSLWVIAKRQTNPRAQESNADTARTKWEGANFDDPWNIVSAKQLKHSITESRTCSDNLLRIPGYDLFGETMHRILSQISINF
jgi:hypothetical protein